jgi:methyltransferase (TIGR00027 family)
MTTGNRFAVEQLSAVSNTALFTFWARAMEARSQDPMLPDPAAVALCEKLRPQLATLATPFHQQLVEDQVPAILGMLMAVRGQYMDAMARSFLSRFPRAVVVNLGAGLDTRFARLEAASEPHGKPGHSGVRVVDIDLPEMIALRQQLLDPHPRHAHIAASVLDFGWMDALDHYDDHRFIFIAEGLLMYLPPDEVKRLLITLAHRFPGSELVGDVFSAVWLRPPLRKWTMRKAQHQLHFSRDAAFHFGLDSPDEMQTWDAQIHFLSYWSLFDSDERKLGWLRWLRHIRPIRMFQYVVHYRLG